MLKASPTGLIDRTKGKDDPVDVLLSVCCNYCSGTFSAMTYFALEKAKLWIKKV